MAIFPLAPDQKKITRPVTSRDPQGQGRGPDIFGRKYLQER